jgi:hypothetical protein
MEVPSRALPGPWRPLTGARSEAMACSYVVVWSALLIGVASGWASLEDDQPFLCNGTDPRQHWQAPGVANDNTTVPAMLVGDGVCDCCGCADEDAWDDDQSDRGCQRAETLRSVVQERIAAHKSGWGEVSRALGRSRRRETSSLAPARVAAERFRTELSERVRFLQSVIESGRSQYSTLMGRLQSAGGPARLQIEEQLRRLFHSLTTAEAEGSSLIKARGSDLGPLDVLAPLAGGCFPSPLVSDKVARGGSTTVVPKRWRVVVCPFRNVTQEEWRPDLWKAAEEGTKSVSDTGDAALRVMESFPHPIELDALENSGLLLPDGQDVLSPNTLIGRWRGEWGHGVSLPLQYERASRVRAIARTSLPGVPLVNRRSGSAVVHPDGSTASTLDGGSSVLFQTADVGETAAGGASLSSGRLSSDRLRGFQGAAEGLVAVHWGNADCHADAAKSAGLPVGPSGVTRRTDVLFVCDESFGRVLSVVEDGVCWYKVVFGTVLACHRKRANALAFSLQP